MTTTATPPSAEKAKTGTAYIIIEFNEETDEWKESGDRIKAASGWAAIRKHVDGRRLAGPDGASGERTFVAIPERSWHPVKVTAEVQTTIKLTSP